MTIGWKCRKLQKNCEKNIGNQPKLRKKFTQIREKSRKWTKKSRKNQKKNC